MHYLIIEAVTYIVPVLTHDDHIFVFLRVISKALF
jgi:hypothetical protein